MPRPQTPGALNLSWPAQAFPSEPVKTSSISWPAGPQGPQPAHTHSHIHARNHAHSFIVQSKAFTESSIRYQTDLRTALMGVA